ncbi:von Willebrand factor type A domain-containing protein [Nonomuraea typhae]|uniref:von Willebrand factor type A domain-containing protein n=1 Tax=Nonomuraea typhae TaxID=2603600 RepID=A0ABW7Z7P9_9ACTN
MAGLLLLAACGGPGGGSTASEAKAPQQGATASEQEADAAPGDNLPRPSSSASKAEGDDTTTAQISTFALDVDTASYGYARRTLAEGRWPEPGMIRPEEFVNAFRQDYAQPRDNGFTVHTDGARTGQGETAVVRVGLQTRASDPAARRPANLTFVIDVSGSMAEVGRLDLVKASLRTLIGQLAPGDQVSIVTFSDQATRVASMTPLVSRGELYAAIDRIGIGGGTNLESGLILGYEEAAKAFRPAATNRVILLSDGLANQGDTQWQSLLAKVKEQAGKQITLLSVGVGREYGDELMEQLADNADGAAVYMSSEEEATKIFSTHLTTTIELRARDAKAQVVFNPRVVESHRLIGYDNRALATEDFRDDTKDGGEIGPGHSVTALYVVTLKPGATGQLATATVRWQDPDTRMPAEASKSVDAADLSPSMWEKAPPRLQVDLVAAAFALYMRDQEAFGLDLPTLAARARELAANVEDPMVNELASLIGKADGVR